LPSTGFQQSSPGVFEAAGILATPVSQYLTIR
jgi:hypothetical protein